MTTITLPETLDRKAISELTKTIMSHRGSEILVDAAPVQKITTIGAELLVAARHQWQSDDNTIKIRNWGDDALQALARIGVAPELLSDGEGS